MRCSDTPFHKQKPVSRACGRRKRLMRCSDTPFQAENPVSRAQKEGEVQMPCSDTPFLIEKHVSRTEIRCGGYDSCSDTPFHKKKPCITSMGREKKTNRSHTTLHNTIRSSHKTTPHHITSYHIISQPYPNPTTLPTDKTPYHASNTIHYNTIQQKPFLPKNWRKSFINLSANRLS